MEPIWKRKKQSVLISGLSIEEPVNKKGTVTLTENRQGDSPVLLGQMT